MKPDQRWADLHLHTFHSDGTFSPEEVVRRAKGFGLACISITDHDTLDGIAGAKEAADGELEILSGVELTVVFKERELHLLGYGFRLDDPALTAFLNRMKKYRVDRIQGMIDRLRSHGVEISLEEVQAVAGVGSIGRPHLAEVLVKRGFVRSMDEAFQRYIGDQAPCFIKGATLTVPEAVRLVGEAGGVAILAHPHRLVEDGWFPDLISSGIQGIEVYHSDHDPSVARKYRKITQAHQLLVTGGSDCHGNRRSGGPLIGTVTIPYDCVEQLKAALNVAQG